MIFEPKGFEWAGNGQATAICGDSLAVLQTMPDACVDLIFADPPYGLNKDFGAGNDRFLNIDEYFAWCKGWIDACMRVLKPNGTLYLMASTQYMPALDRYAEETYHVVNRIVWVYDSSGVQPKRKFGSQYEPILMVTHSAKAAYTFNADAVAVEAKTGAVRKLTDYRKTPPQPYSTRKIPGNVWSFPRVRYRMPEYENHPTQKPEALLERIILASSNPGDTVLDPFSGSFTACAVAVQNGRRAIGIDVNPAYYKIGLRRTGIAREYRGEALARDTSRKTRNKSKADHRS